MCFNEILTTVCVHQVFACGQLTPEAMQAFQREVYVMNCLRHPNVVLLMGACQTPPRRAILMEFVAGGSLHKVGVCWCVCECVSGCVHHHI